MYRLRCFKAKPPDTCSTRLRVSGYHGENAMCPALFSACLSLMARMHPACIHSRTAPESIASRAKFHECSSPISLRTNSHHPACPLAVQLHGNCLATGCGGIMMVLVETRSMSYARVVVGRRLPSALGFVGATDRAADLAHAHGQALYRALRSCNLLACVALPIPLHLLWSCSPVCRSWCASWCGRPIVGDTHHMPGSGRMLSPAWAKVLTRSRQGRWGRCVSCVQLLPAKRKPAVYGLRARCCSKRVIYACSHLLLIQELLAHVPRALAPVFTLRLGCCLHVGSFGPSTAQHFVHRSPGFAVAGFAPAPAPVELRTESAAPPTPQTSWPLRL